MISSSAPIKKVADLLQYNLVTRRDNLFTESLAANILGDDGLLRQ